ncbi:MAG: hypothetical protein H7836_10675 [Magnetococcus sp. YQC-3]
MPDKACAPEAIAKRRLFESQVATGSPDAELLLRYGDFLHSVGLVDEALVQLHTSLELSPNNMDVLLKLVALYKETSQWVKAADIMQRIVLQNHYDPLYYAELVDLLLKCNLKKDACNALFAQIEHGVDSDNAFLRLRDLLRDTDENDKLVSVCKKILENNPNDTTTWSVLALAFRSLGQSSQTISAYSSLLVLMPDDPRANLYVGIDFFERSTLENQDLSGSAVDSLRKAYAGRNSLNRVESNLASLYFMSSLLHSSKHKEEGHDLCVEIDVSVLTDEQVKLLSACYELLGDIELNYGGYEKSIKFYEKSINLVDRISVKKKMAAIFRDRGDALYKRRRYGRAMQEYKQGLVYLNDDPDLLLKHKKSISNKKIYISIITSISVVFTVCCLYFIHLYIGEEKARLLEERRVAALRHIDEQRAADAKRLQDEKEKKEKQDEERRVKALEYMEKIKRDGTRK